MISYSPLGAGFLTGKYRKDGEIPSGTRFDVIPGHQDIYFSDENFDRVEKLRAISERIGRSMIQLALALGDRADRHQFRPRGCPEYRAHRSGVRGGSDRAVGRSSRGAERTVNQELSPSISSNSLLQFSSTFIRAKSPPQGSI